MVKQLFKSEKAASWLKSCYSGLKSILAGVSQGSFLRPLLLSVYIDDIAKRILV